MSEVHSSISYDLPYCHEDTKIVLVSRDPNCLFAYWGVSESKKKAFIEEFGAELWQKSIPVIKIINLSNNCSFYIEINDFTNNWYINVPHADSLYVAELGRRISESFFINLASSNYVATPSNVVSPNTSAYFADYSDIRSGRLDADSGKIFETYNYKSHANFISGISSPELMRMGIQQSLLGISSAELFGVSPFEFMEISSKA